MKTIGFLNIKGGVGKTTTSFNVAAGLAEMGKRVLLVDFDPQANTTSIFFKERPKLTITNLIRSMITPNNADKLEPMEVAKEITPNLWVMPSALDLTMFDVELRLNPTIQQHDVLHKVLQSVCNNFDYCIIDCGPIMNLLTMNVIIPSDLLIIPIKPDTFAVDGFLITTSNIATIRENFQLKLEYKVLFTIVNRNNAEKEIINEVKKRVGARNIFKTQIRNQPKPIAEASSHKGLDTHKGLVIQNKESKVAQDMWNLIEEIIALDGGKLDGR